MIGIIKGDARFTYLHLLINDSILGDKLSSFIGIDELILPFKGIDNTGLISGTNIYLEDIIKNNSIKRIIAGYNNLKLNSICDKYNILCEYLFENKSFIYENAFMTCKALLYFESSLLSKYSSSIIIAGYGNIGFYLAKLLKANRIEFSIYPNNKYEEKYARLEEYRVDRNLEAYDVIINTIPSNLDVDYNKIKNAKILDLSSKPYGFDVLKLEEYKIDYRILSSLPSRYNPYQAAIIIKKYI